MSIIFIIRFTIGVFYERTTYTGDNFGILAYMKSLSLSRPHLLITVGIPGSGKSFFAQKFAATFNTPFIDYSVILDIASHNNHISDVFAGYALKELFKTNQSIVFDGPSSTRAERAALKELARSHGYSCLFIMVQTDPATAQGSFY